MEDDKQQQLPLLLVAGAPHSSQQSMGKLTNF
jgi:hypothetical protein